ncbi:MAG: bifunctional DNA-formamidopyrimidine glycosylase/DNA-(apurinic or apyrimidinic site) lyase [Anaerolineae bacterium]|nr:bifunctional DNA-formamidopyrimidine glycosylase/DNA-(apurinic or apyrimidinic site) lyase [Anaerolineae bacterium]MDW8172790.1 bifunctional DNA-formamidopyrimidine glycosylase/DNA-(apurinic or apyrimidinic site) lyase [Anaerolineae bacterium]
MPELPEVETVVRGLRPLVQGRTFQSAQVHWPRSLHSPAPQDFAVRLAGQQVRAVQRRAKYIILSLDDDYLLVHLKMTGRLYVWPSASSDEDADERWVRVRLRFTDGDELRFSDARKFGKLYLTADLASVLGKLGPEPLEDDFQPRDFIARLRGHQRALKALLLDQTFIAGVGNIYADEALFRAGLHPLRPAHSLDNDEAVRLYQAIRQAMGQAIDQMGSSVNWYRQADGTRGEAQHSLLAYGRNGQPCLVCGTTIAKMRVVQRGTHFCPNCQPAP